MKLKKCISGVLIYLFGLIMSLIFMLLFKKYDVLGIIPFIFIMPIFNPFMIYIYDELLGRKPLDQPWNYYDLMVIACFMIELLFWDYIHPLSGNIYFIKTALGIFTASIFLLYFIVVYFIRNKQLDKKKIIRKLVVFPLLTYYLFALFITGFILLISQWNGKI